MSLQGQREEIRAALATLPALSPSAYRPKVFGTGSCWPLVGELARDGVTPDFAVEWRLMVVLPADEAAASVWFDTHHESIADALEDFAWVERITPATMGTDVGDLQVLVFSMRRES